MNIDDWNHLRSFLAVAEAGSLSAAARQLQLSQPTVGRHVSDLARTLGVALFERHPRGLALTERGAELLETARHIGQGVDRFTRMAQGLSEIEGGTVRISASEVVAHFVLPEILADIASHRPELQLEVVADNRVANLLRRDADIAIRMIAPTQLDLIARRVAAARFGLYASRAYIEASGMPQTLTDLRAHRLIGFDRETSHLQVLSQLGLTLVREDFSLRSDSHTFLIHAVRAGLGIGALQQAMVDATQPLVQVLPALSLPTLPLWLVSHADLRQSVRVRRVYDLLASGLDRFYSHARGPSHPGRHRAHHPVEIL